VSVATYGKYSVNFSNPNTTWAIAASFVVNGSVVLDVGCSAGQMAEQLTRLKGCVVDGIEIDQDDAAEARAHCREVFVGDVLQLAPGLGDRRYRHILLLDVLEHLLDPAAALRALTPLLADDGTLIVSVPNMAHASVRLALLQGRFEYEDDGLLDRTHLRFFDADELQGVVGRAGLRVRREARTFHDLPRDVIDLALRTVGLQATDEFVALMNAEAAATYQYVLELSPGDGEASVDAAASAYVAPLHQYRHFYEDAVAAARAGEAHAAEAARLRQELEERYETSIVPPAWVMRLWKRRLRRRTGSA
jgi:2-polyprenyl-3-methyl-5-hydroxy-6-metoxy-1,4-benzoquinol methylase